MGFDARPDLACLTTKDSMLKFKLLCINNLGPKVNSLEAVKSRNKLLLKQRHCYQKNDWGKFCFQPRRPLECHTTLRKWQRSTKMRIFKKNIIFLQKLKTEKGWAQMSIDEADRRECSACGSLVKIKSGEMTRRGSSSFASWLSAWLGGQMDLTDKIQKSSQLLQGWPRWWWGKD